MTKAIGVAVLGAGIMGAATALLLARRGIRVTLFDKAARPFEGASRWNEGKIHLGHLYAADPSLRTARRLLPGGLGFKRLVEALVGTSISAAITDHDDTYLLHRESVVDAASMERYLHAVTALAREHPDANEYLAELSGATTIRLTMPQIEASYDTAKVVAAFRAPERSVDTQWIADRFVAALDAEVNIEQRMATFVRGVRRIDSTSDSKLSVDAGDPLAAETFDFVVNALWEGRLAVDAGMGLSVPPVRTHRYRLSAFVDTHTPVAVPSAVVATGPFGDLKSYSGTRFYLSWYESGLRAEGGGISPPAAADLDSTARKRIAEDIFDKLGSVVPAARDIGRNAASLRLEGGWVYAVGKGSLDEKTSDLHRRDRIGIERAGSYISVDTGKYSIAPWLAVQIADMIAPLG